MFELFILITVVFKLTTKLNSIVVNYEPEPLVDCRFTDIKSSNKL